MTTMTAPKGPKAAAKTAKAPQRRARDGGSGRRTHRLCQALEAVLEGFPPSAQRDYLEWIADAKQDSTREKRIATAVEWLSEGKRRHWKYQNC